MKRRNVGSAHVIIVIVLVMALLGALGFIFYQNFIAKKADTGASSASTTETSTASEDTVKTKDIAMTEVFKNGLTVSYPETWSVVRMGVQGENPPTDDSATIDSYIFTSPDKSIQLRLNQASGGGFGGACNPDEEGTIATYGYESSSAWPGHTYVEYSFEQPESSKTLVAQSITSEPAAKTLQTGDSQCSVRFFNVDYTGRDATPNNDILLFSNVSSTSSADTALSVANAADAKTYFASQNAKDIKSILLSLH